MSSWEYIILFLSVILGGGIALLIKRNNPRLLRMSLSFSGAYILGIAALHLMPVVFAGQTAAPGFWILAGFFIQLLLDQLSRGVEHGHVHALHGATTSAGIQILIGLSLHSFIEGMPLSSYPHLHGGQITGEHHFNHLLVGIIIHKAPAAFALVILLLQSHFSRRFIIISLIVFAAMTPAGAFAGQQLVFDEKVFRLLMAVVVGSFLHISTTILFEADDNNQHHISFRKLAVIAAGFGLALLTLLN